jgi:hypothetical protein
MDLESFDALFARFQYNPEDTPEEVRRKLEEFQKSLPILEVEDVKQIWAPPVLELPDLLRQRLEQRHKDRVRLQLWRKAQRIKKDEVKRKLSRTP